MSLFSAITSPLKKAGSALLKKVTTKAPAKPVSVPIALPKKTITGSTSNAVRPSTSFDISKPIASPKLDVKSIGKPNVPGVTNSSVLPAHLRKPAAVVGAGLGLGAVGLASNPGGRPTVPQVKASPSSGSSGYSGSTPTVPRAAAPAGNTSGYAPLAIPDSGGSTRNADRPKKIEPPKPSAAERAVSDAEKLYSESMRLGPDELSTQGDLDRLVEATKKAYTGTKDKTIPLEFITGQLASIEERALNLAEPLESKLARLQASRTNALEATKFSLDRADRRLESEQKAEAERMKPLTVGSSVLQYDKATGTYKSVYSAPQEGFTLGEGQKRYDAFGNELATNAKPYSSGASAEAQSWATLIEQNKASISDVPSEIRSQVAAALGAPGRAQVQNPAQRQAVEQATTAITNIDKAIGMMDNVLGGITGNSAWGRVIGQIIPGSEARNLNVSLDTVRALIGFDALQKMREASPTGGALGNITERELSFLQSVQGSLDIGQSSGQLRGTLGSIKKSFERIRAINTVNITPEQYVSQFPDASDAEVQEYIQLYDGRQLQANASGNRPQRNNNPGNVKEGGVADQLSIGSDEQGHLIFPDADTGFQAMQQDLFAKLSGRSSHVPANPTIAQLGKAWAEDQNWPNKVAAYLGVSPSTRATAVDFDSLVQAIAKQEGWYA